MEIAVRGFLGTVCPRNATKTQYYMCRISIESTSRASFHVLNSDRHFVENSDGHFVNNSDSHFVDDSDSPFCRQQ
jgi:hypothetical protein